jgi:hypothetical protein
MSAGIDQAETLRSLVEELQRRTAHGAATESSGEAPARDRASTQEDELRDWITVNVIDTRTGAISAYPWDNSERDRSAPAPGMEVPVAPVETLVHWKLGDGSKDEPVKPGTASHSEGVASE